MDATLADINIDDPTAGGAEDEISAPGVTDNATAQKQRKEKKSKKSKSSEDVEMADAETPAKGDAMDVDEKAIEKKLKKEKKEKRKSKGEDEPAKKKKKSKAE